MNDEIYLGNLPLDFFYLYECHDGVKQLVMAAHVMSERKREREFFFMMQLPPNSHRLGLTWSGQLSGNSPRATEFAAI